MVFVSPDRLRIRLILCLTIISLLHLAGFAISLPKPEALYEDATVGVVLVPWHQDDVAVDSHPVDGHLAAEVTAPQQPAVAEPPTPSKEIVTDNIISEPSVTEPVLTEKLVVEEAVPEPLTADVSPVLLQPPFAVSEQIEPAQPAVVAPNIVTDTTEVALSQSATQSSPETSTELLNKSAAPRSDQQAMPRYGHHPPPSYPRIARQRGWYGIVEYEVRVLPTGKVAGLVLKSSSGYRVLDEAARKAIAQWRFNPATGSGIPIESWVVVPVEFVLDTHR